MHWLVRHKQRVARRTVGTQYKCHNGIEDWLPTCREKIVASMLMRAPIEIIAESLLSANKPLQ
jgi:hypothetical protein